MYLVVNNYSGTKWLTERLKIFKLCMQELGRIEEWEINVDVFSKSSPVKLINKNCQWLCVITGRRAFWTNDRVPQDQTSGQQNMWVFFAKFLSNVTLVASAVCPSVESKLVSFSFYGSSPCLFWFSSLYQVRSTKLSIIGNIERK